MSADNSLSSIHGQEQQDAWELLVSVILLPGGTLQQRENTKNSVRTTGQSWFEFREWSGKETNSGLPPLPVDRKGYPDFQACRGRYVMFLAPGDILLPEFYEDVPEAIQDSPDVIKLASFANAEKSWFCAIPKSDVKASYTPDLTPWCKLFRASLLELPKVMEASPVVLLRSMAINILLRNPESCSCSQPQLIHPQEPPSFTPDMSGWRHLKAYIACMEYYAATCPSDIWLPHYVTLRGKLLQLAFCEGFRLHRQISPLLSGLLACWLRYRHRRALRVCGKHDPQIRKAYSAARLAVSDELADKKKVEMLLRAMEERGNELRQKPVINVLFIAISPAIWKVDSVVRAMLAHPRFNPRVLVVPEIPIQSADTRRKQMADTVRFMEERGYPVFTLCDENGQGEDVRIPEEYDIRFYPKPYPNVVPEALDYPLYPDKLLINVHYGFHTTCNPHFFTQPSQRNGWIDCYENESVASIARLFKTEWRDNAVVTGLPFADGFLSPPEPLVSPWKPQNGTVKKVIWAPHWTILPDYMYLSHFLEMAEEMKELVTRTAGRIQWAFKPHPLLYDSLCMHPDWGKERTDAYYAWWADGKSTQLEAGSYEALFMHSDAMVHDSSSFICDYHLSANPVLFLARDLRTHMAEANPMSREATEAQYIGKGMEDVERFIYDTVLGGDDPMQERRRNFREHYLVPPHGRRAAENLIEYILTGRIPL